MFASNQLLLAVLASAGWASAAAMLHPEHEIAARNPVPGTFVGYRYLSQTEMDVWTRAERVVYDRSYDHTAYGEQLGPGLYTAQTATLTQYPGRLICAIIAQDPSAFKNTPKYSVPISNRECQALWGYGDRVEQYGKTINPAWTNENTIRLSQITGMSTTTFQSVIGPSLLEQNKYVYDCCKPNEADCIKRLIQDYGKADYGSWDIHGGVPEKQE